VRPEADDYPLTVEFERPSGLLLWRGYVHAGQPFPELNLDVRGAYRMTIKTRDGRIFRQVEMADNRAVTIVSKLDP